LRESGADILLEVEGITKAFGQVMALQGVSLRLQPGRVHAVLGENGAGKSTLMKIISGVYPPTSGTIRVGGEPVTWARAEQARSAGISTIFQEFILLPNLSVAENLFLGREPRKRLGLIDFVAMRRESRRILEELGLDIDPDVLTGSLRVADQQMIEIAKGVIRDARVFVFDEPTAALGDREAEKLFGLIRRLKDKGNGILYISHRLPELFELCDEVTVLKDGQFAGYFEISNTSVTELVTTMVGRSLDQLFPARNSRPGRGKPRLRMRNVVVEGLAGPVNLEIGPNEVVGLAGLEGQGQIEVTRAIFEGHTLISGEILLDDRPFDHKGPQAASLRASASSRRIARPTASSCRSASRRTSPQAFCRALASPAPPRVSGPGSRSRSGA
jgi:ribose transport system ATP-binding protein